MEKGDEIAAMKTRRGDRDAFHALVDRHCRAVFHLAFRMTGNETDAQDVVQETFFKAWKQIAQFDGRASFSTWLHRICTNCALDHIRSRRRKQESQHGEDATDLIPTGAPSPERLARSAQIASILTPALEALTEMERAAFVLRHYEGKSIEEIAETLGVQPGAAKHSVFRAVQKLRRVLEPARSATG